MIAASELMVRQAHHEGGGFPRGIDRAQAATRLCQTRLTLSLSKGEARRAL